METRERKRLMSSAYRYAFSRLALNYYSFCEMMLETPEMKEDIRTRAKEFGELLDAFLRGEDRAGEIVRLRARNRKEMEILTSYGDCFVIYEYVLNRMERRFRKIDPPDETPEEFADRVIDILQMSEDALILDSRLRSVVAQLPIRYTRQKFYSLVQSLLTTYVGCDKSGVESLLYMLRTSAMMDIPEGRAEDNSELERIYTALRDADYRNLDGEGYERCCSLLKQGVGAYLIRSDMRSAYQNLLNDLYILFLSRGEAMIDVWEDNLFRHIVAGVQEHFQNDSLTGMDEALTESLEDLEGIQESARERIHFKENETDDDLMKMELLMSGSDFATLEPDEGPQEQADRKWLEEKGRQLCNDLEASFQGQPKAVIRAVMAGVLSRLPMNFHSVEDLREYVKSSLLSCTDYAEREASMELLEEELFRE